MANYSKKKKFIINKPILILNINILKENQISIDELKKFFPKYILRPSPIYYGTAKNILFKIIQFFLETLVKVFLRPRESDTGSLDLKEVNEVYTREAATYNKKHHLTTRGMDLVWRRNVGWFLAIDSRGKDSPVTILDLCTGTGLTIREILKILEQWGIKANIVGLDFNLGMLNIAKTDPPISSNCVINFVKGDAMDLFRMDPTSKVALTQFEKDTFDYVVQMFGVGGISDPIKEFYGVLRILKSNGKFFLIDMHKPIPELHGELPLFLKWFRFPTFETFIYERATIPLVLNKLWGWRDTTLCFYFLPLVVFKDEDDNFWGFETVYYVQDSQRWWFGLPFMPIAKIIVKKVIITKEEADKRYIILQSCVSSLKKVNLVEIIQK